MTTRQVDLLATRGDTFAITVAGVTRHDGAAINWAFPATARVTIKKLPSDLDASAIAILVSPGDITLDSVAASLRCVVPATVFNALTSSRWVYYSAKITDGWTTKVQAGRIWVQIPADSTL